mgnify:FL=1
MSKVEIYAVGIASMSVCALDSMTKEEIEAEANRQSPTGISSHWHIAEESTFAGGEPMPRKCYQLGGRLHRLLHC